MGEDLRWNRCMRHCSIGNARTRGCRVRSEIGCWPVRQCRAELCTARRRMDWRGSMPEWRRRGNIEQLAGLEKGQRLHCARRSAGEGCGRQTVVGPGRAVLHILTCPDVAINEGV